MWILSPIMMEYIRFWEKIRQIFWRDKETTGAHRSMRRSEAATGVFL